MKNVIVSLVMVISFIAVSTAQQKEVVKKEVKEVKEVKKCDENCTKPCCAKKEGKHAECKDNAEGHKHGEAKKCCSEDKSKCCGKDGSKKECAHDKVEKKECTDHKHGEAKKCGADCTKPCCADKKGEVKKEVVKVKSDAKVVFACPMKCEGDKTYVKEGKCPKCNMNLKPSKG